MIDWLVGEIMIFRFLKTKIERKKENKEAKIRDVHCEYVLRRIHVVMHLMTSFKLSHPD